MTSDFDKKHALESRSIWAAMLMPAAMKLGETLGIPPETLINFALLYIPVVFGLVRQITAGGLRWGLGNDSGSTSRSPVIVAVLVLGLVLVLSACASSPRAKVVVSQRGADIALNLVADQFVACEQKTFTMTGTPEQKAVAWDQCEDRRVERATVISRGLPTLRAYTEAVARGELTAETPAFQKYRIAVKGVLDELEVKPTADQVEYLEWINQ